MSSGKFVLCWMNCSRVPMGRNTHRRSFVKDRPGHDLRYAIDAGKIARELGWMPQETFESGIRKTVQWYLEERNGWCRAVQAGKYQRERLGSGEAAGSSSSIKESR